MIPTTGRTPGRPNMQNFPGTPAHKLERAMSTVTATTSGIVCAHCGGWHRQEHERNHLCMASLLDWAEYDGMNIGEHTLNEWMDYCETVVKLAS